MHVSKRHRMLFNAEVTPVKPFSMMMMTCLGMTRDDYNIITASQIASNLSEYLLFQYEYHKIYLKSILFSVSEKETSFSITPSKCQHPRNSNTQKNWRNSLNFEQCSFNKKNADTLAKRVDPDQEQTVWVSCFCQNLSVRELKDHYSIQRHDLTLNFKDWNHYFEVSSSDKKTLA